MEISARTRKRKITPRRRRRNWREQRRKTKWSHPRRRAKVRRGRPRPSRARAKPRWGPKVVESNRHKSRVRIGHLRFNGGCFYHFRRKRRHPKWKVRRRRYIFDSFGTLYSYIYIHWYFNPKSSIHFILYNPRWSVSSWHCVCPFNKNSYLTLSSEFWSWWIFYIYLDSQGSYHDFCFIKSEDEDEEMESEEEEEEDDEEEEEESSPEKK